MSDQTVPRREILGEVVATLVVRVVWAGFFVVSGTVLHAIYNDPIALTALLAATLALLGLALLIEYRRAERRLQRYQPVAPVSQTVGGLYDDLPEGEWTYLPEWGIRVKKVPGVATVKIDGTGDCG
jgi:hypothetical protein